MGNNEFTVNMDKQGDGDGGNFYLGESRTMARADLITAIEFIKWAKKAIHELREALDKEESFFTTRQFDQIDEELGTAILMLKDITLKI